MCHALCNSFLSLPHDVHILIDPLFTRRKKTSCCLAFFSVWTRFESSNFRFHHVFSFRSTLIGIPRPVPVSLSRKGTIDKMSCGHERMVSYLLLRSCPGYCMIFSHNIKLVFELGFSKIQPKTQETTKGSISSTTSEVRLHEGSFFTSCFHNH